MSFLVDARGVLCNSILRTNISTTTNNSNNNNNSNTIEDTSEPPPTRHKRSAVDDLICPITRELPIDPCYARDGRLYDRCALEQFFETAGGPYVRSPITNAYMEKEMFPAPQMKSLIETLIETKVITGDFAKTWTRKLQQEQYRKTVLQQAKNGDLTKMELVGHNYKRGLNGFRKDEDKAFEWLERARKHGSVFGMAHVGDMLASGTGPMAANVTQGVMYLSRAAEKGSLFASYKLGMALAEGRYELPVDKEDAIEWLNKALRKSSRDFLTEEDRREARSTLVGLQFSQA